MTNKDLKKLEPRKYDITINDDIYSLEKKAKSGNIYIYDKNSYEHCCVTSKASDCNISLFYFFGKGILFRTDVRPDEIKLINKIK